jgi:hypothetical protein
MAKKPSKIIFCHYNHPLVEELAEWYSNKYRQAQNTVRKLNDDIAPDTGELDSEFYFLNSTIGGETHIITVAGQKHYPTNDPAIVAKLEAYLASLERPVAGAAQQRGVGLQFIPAYEARLESETHLQYPVINEQTGVDVLQELRHLYHEKISAKMVTIKDKPCLRVTSWYIPHDVLEKAIYDIINS